MFMSKNKLQQKSSLAKMPDHFQLVSPWIFTTAFLVAFLVPNLVFADRLFFSGLHILKWSYTLLPLAIMGCAAGYRLLRRGSAGVSFRLDGFAAVWFLLILLVTVQPLWLHIRSIETFYREWFFFAALWLVYALSLNLADSRLVRALSWGALLNAAINVLFAELQVRGWEAPFSFIIPSGGQYMGNTGQQNMFALWMAIAAVGGIFLALTGRSSGRKPLATVLLWILLATVIHGLVSSTSRSGILALATGFFVMGAFFLRKRGRGALAPLAAVALLAVALTFAEVKTDTKTAAALSAKLEDVVTRPLSIAHRDSIWATSWTMFSLSPWKGVGLGQYKWHYLDAQKNMLLRWPRFEWQYTRWAHNEFLQWMAETGVVGAALMFILWGWWGAAMIRAFVKKRPISDEAIWGSALVACFLFNALWTRPFHRIENAVWLALAFAVTNREIMGGGMRSLRFPRLRDFGYRALGAAIASLSLVGILYFGNGLYGDAMLRAADMEGEPFARNELLKKAYSCPMVRDVAERQLCYFSVELGVVAEKPEMIIDGLNALIRYVEKKPDTEDIRFLMEWSKRLEDKGLMDYMMKFLIKQPEPPASGASVEGE